MTPATISEFAQARRLVVKAGSWLLVEGGEARSAWLASLAGDEILGYAPRAAVLNRDHLVRL